MISMNASACEAALPRETNIDAAVAMAAVLRKLRRCTELVLSYEPIRWLWRQRFWWAVEV
jgi:hypothetical protein